MYRRLALLTGGLVLLGTVLLDAQEPILEQTYGTGVHTYFSRDYVKAHELFTAAIDGGSKDPRCHYFRGLCCLRLGREDGARLDFGKGGELEASGTGSVSNVSKSLERIQGSCRLLMEEYRTKARMAALERELELRAKRYEEIRLEEQRALRQQAEKAPEKPIGMPDQPAASAEGSPFGLSPINEPAPVKPAVDTSTEPAAATPAPAAPAPAKPAMGDDPFAAPAPAAPAPAKPAAGDDPFAAPAPAAPAPTKPAMGDDPFAAPAPAAPAPATPAPAKPAAGDDPFAVPAPAAAAPATPAAAKPAAGDDPFAVPAPAAPAPAKSAAGDDPFAVPAPAAPAPAKSAAGDDPFAVPAPAAPAKK